MGELSVWELFLEEIKRNITPSKESIKDQLSFLIKGSLCSEEKYSAIVAVRYMAAYEQSVNEYLHPPLDFKQANIKAELIHFGSIFEGLFEITLVSLYKNKAITTENYNTWFPNNKAIDLIIHEEKLSKKQKNKQIRPLQFKSMIDCLLKWNEHKNNENKEIHDFIKLADTLRVERNNVHISHMVSTSIFHEEYKLVKVREQWDRFISTIKQKI
jgi:hypothetical protein